MFFLRDHHRRRAYEQLAQYLRDIRRLRDARHRGRVALSGEVSAFRLLVTLICVPMGSLATNVRSLLGAVLERGGEGAFN